MDLAAHSELLASTEEDRTHPASCLLHHMELTQPLWASGPVCVHLYCPQVDSKGSGVKKVAHVIQVVCGRGGTWIQTIGVQITERPVGAADGRVGLLHPTLRAPLLTTSTRVSCCATSHGGKVRMLLFFSLLCFLVVTAWG